jgi:hypothetical protein
MHHQVDVGKLVVDLDQALHLQRAGPILKSPSAARIRELLSAYERRFTEGFYPYEPPRDKPGPLGGATQQFC